MWVPVWAPCSKLVVCRGWLLPSRVQRLGFCKPLAPVLHAVCATRRGATAEAAGRGVQSGVTNYVCARVCVGVAGALLLLATVPVSRVILLDMPYRIHPSFPISFEFSHEYFKTPTLK